MNYKNLMLSLTTCLMAIPAVAAITCKGDDQKSQITVEAFAGRLYDKTVTITGEQGKISYFGKTKFDEGFLYSSKTIELFNETHSLVGNLVISSQPQACGRGSCLPIKDGILQEALLQIGNGDEYFSCSGHH